jgi:hypothetical protein
MRGRAAPFVVLILMGACEPLPLDPETAAGSRAAPDHRVDAADAPLSAAGCSFELFATLHAGGADPGAGFVGTIHFRVSATGEGGAESAYHGRLVPPGPTPYGQVDVSILRREAAGQAVWSHTAKLDPAPTPGHQLHFGGQDTIDPALAGELIETPDAFSVVVNPDPATGGHEAEGDLGPVRGDPPNTVRDLGRSCFGGTDGHGLP